MFKKIILFCLVFLMLFSSVLSPKVSAFGDDIPSKIKGLEYCGVKPYDTDEIANFYATRVNESKEKGSIDLYNNYYFSSCFYGQVGYGKYNEIGDVIEKIRDIESKAGIFRIDENFTTDAKKPTDTIALLKENMQLNLIAFAFGLVDPINDLITVIPNPFGSYDAKNFELGAFMSDVIMPIRTPKFLKDRGVDLDMIILMTMVIFMMFITLKLALGILKMMRAKDSESTQYEMRKTMLDEILTPFLFVVIGIKFIGLMMVIFANLLLPTIYSSASVQSSYNCKSVFATYQPGKLQYQDSICKLYNAQGSVCATKNNSICAIRTAFVSSNMDRMAQVSTKSLKEMPWVNTAPAMAILYSLLSAPFFLVIFVFIAFNYWRLLKTIYDMFIENLFVYIYAINSGSLSQYFNELKSHLILFVVRSALISVSLVMIIPLLAGNWFNNLLLIFIALGIPAISDKIASKFGAISSLASPAMIGLDKVEHKLSHAKKEVKKTTKRGFRLANYIQKLQKKK